MPAEAARPLASPPMDDPRIPFAFAVLDRAQELAARTDAPVHPHRFGPLSLDVQVVGAPAHARKTLRPLAAAAVEAAGGAFRVIAIDGAGPDGAGLVRHLAAPPEGLDLSVLYHRPDLGLTMRYHPELGTWRILSRPHRLAVNWAADASRVPDWEDGFPFRNLIHWMSFGTSWSMVHAAGLGRRGRGLLLTGAGGSGKSTTTAAAVLAGLQTVGDDFVLVEQKGADHPPRAHLVYDCLRFDEASLDMLPDYRSVLSNPERSEGQKAQMHLSDLLPAQLAQTLALEAIVVPRVTRSGETRLVRADGALALKAMLPSTAFLLSGGGAEAAQKISRLSRDLPVHLLEIGGTPLEAARALETLLA